MLASLPHSTETAPASDSLGSVGETRWWTLLSATGAPLLLMGGWTLAAGRQPAGFDSCHDTISALAGLGAKDRWIMTAALYGLGSCHVVTALGLRSASVWGRRILGFGGVCTLLVASLPLPASPLAPATGHLTAATAAFVSLTVWPLFALRRKPGTPAALRPGVSMLAVTVLGGLLGWLGVEVGARTHLGLAERAAAGAQALWPLVVAVSTSRFGHGGPCPPRLASRPLPAPAYRRGSLRERGLPR